MKLSSEICPCIGITIGFESGFKGSSTLGSGTPSRSDPLWLHLAAGLQVEEPAGLWSLMGGFIEHLLYIELANLVISDWLTHANPRDVLRVPLKTWYHQTYTLDFDDFTPYPGFWSHTQGFDIILRITKVSSHTLEISRVSLRRVCIYIYYYYHYYMCICIYIYIYTYKIHILHTY